MSSKPHHHTLDVYDAELWLATTRKQWRELARTLDHIDPEPRNEAGLSWYERIDPDDGGLPTQHQVIWINVEQHKGDQLALLETVAHEATHCVAQILVGRGHEMTMNDEPAAYLGGWLVRWIWSRVTEVR